MSEYIKKEDAIKKAQMLVVMFSGEPPDKDLTLKKMASIATENIEVLPSIDVVKCRDCKWWTKQSASIQGRCALIAALSGTYPTSEWFCASGELEDEEDD